MIPATLGLMILNYNGRQWLAPLFESVRNNGYPNLRIYLVDNASTDGSVDFVLAEHPEVTVIRMPQNLGYSMAYNLAMPRAFADGCEWIIWANTDILLDPDCLMELSRIAALDPAIGVVGPAFISWDSDEPNYYMRGNHPALIPAMMARSPIPADVDWVEGSLLMVSRAAVETAGPLDPRYFAYWEEADFCRRVRHSGRRVVLALGARARHFGGVSFAAESNRRLRYWLQLRNCHIYKLTDPARNFVANLLDSVHFLATSLKAGIKKSPGAAFPEFRAFIAVWMRLGTWYKKWTEDRRHIRPEPLDRQHRGIQPEILFSSAREAVHAK